jgi:N utilization substance protein A
MTEDINYEIIEALSQIARERNLKREIVLESLEIGLLTAAKRALGTLDPVEVDVDRETGSISLGIVKEVVATEEEIEEPLLQMTVDQAKEVDPDTEVGWHIYVDVPITAFGRMAIQAAKQVLQQRIREAERDKVFEEYLDRVGEIVTGSVQQVSRGTILVNIGRVEAILPFREQIRRERFRQGDTIRALVKEASMSAKGPSIILSRGDPEFVKRLFAIEVPEIYESIVEIKKIARAPGERCKVAVRSHDLRVDAVGACVGMKGSRVQSIVRELSNERIDIVPWSPDVTHFVTKAIGPAKVSRVLIDEENRELTLIMPEDQIALALGPGGANARLAGELVEYRVDVVSESDYERAFKEVEGIYQRIGELSITARQEGLLRSAGVEYVQDLQGFTPEEMEEIPGFGPATVKSIIQKMETFTGEPYVPPVREEEPEEEGEDVEDEMPDAPTVPEPGAEGLDESEWLIDADILHDVEEKTATTVEGEPGEVASEDKPPEAEDSTDEEAQVVPEQAPPEEVAGIDLRTDVEKVEEEPIPQADATQLDDDEISVGEADESETPMESPAPQVVGGLRELRAREQLVESESAEETGKEEKPEEAPESET